MRTTGAAIRAVVGCMPESTLFVSSTGLVSRHLHATLGPSDRCFLMLGSMGLAYALGAGIAAAAPERWVVVLDGDGSFLMGSSTLTLGTDLRLTNLRHVVLNNGCYASTGGQVRPGRGLSLLGFGAAYGYRRTSHFSDDASESDLKAALEGDGPSLSIFETEDDAGFPPRVSIAPEALQRQFRNRLREELSPHGYGPQL